MKKRLSILTLLLFLFSALMFGGIGLDKSTIKKFRASEKVYGNVKAIQNGIINDGVKNILLNPAILNKFDKIFSNSLDIKSVTDQKRSGRCWLFAGLNILRYKARKKFNMDSFELSQNYLYFWDKLEKANLFLENVIRFRDLKLTDPKVKFILENPIPDGGQWNFVVELAEKYGVVPESVMPDTASAKSSSFMNKVLKTLLRKDASILRDLYKKGEKVEKLREKKVEMLKDIYHILVLHLGNPPEKFVFRYKDKDKKVVGPKEYTPLEFYKLIGENLRDYYYLYTCPTRDYFKLYAIFLDKDMADKNDMVFGNIPMDLFKELCKKSLKGGDPVWFSADVGKETYSKKGIMDLNVYDYKSVYGFDIEPSRKERILYRDSIPNHAMVFVGYDDKPFPKWKVENSWGKKAGDNGFFVMSDKWFSEYVYSAVFKKTYLPKKVLEIFKQKPIVLPFDDPMMDLIFPRK